MFKNVFRAFLPLFLAILCFLQSPVAAASSFDELIVAATEITVPSFAKVGKLTESSPTYYDEDDYYGRTKYAGVYKITLTSNQVAKILLGDADTDLYTYLYVLNEDGELVASDHYSGYGNIDVDGTHYWANNSITLSGSGTYYILASTYDELETGAYAIEVKTITVSSFAELAAASTPITAPSFAEVGNLTESSPTYYDEDDYYGRTKYAGVYKITLTGNQVAKILLGDADTDLYTYLYVLNEDGELVASDHYSGYGNIDVDGTHYWANNSITLSGSGTYYILASTYDELETGAYAIEVKTITVSSFAELAAASTPITVPSAQIGNLTESSPTYYNDDYGRTKYAGVYKITLTGNQAVEILLGSADTDIDLDTYLYVLDEDGELVESDDERGSGTPINVGNSEYLANSYISLSSSGTYYILASTYNELETGAYAIEVKNLEKPTISTASLPKGYVDESYHRQLVANRPAEWEIASGELPPGLFLYSSGIYGTPEEAGTFTFIVKATNVKGSETKQLSIVIDPPRKPVFLVPNLANGVKDEYYESGIPVSGSNSVELKDGSLPPGLNFDSDCWSNDCEFDIYGVPTQVGTFTFTIVAENDAGTTEKSYSIKIAQELEPPVILTTTLPNGVIDEEYVAQFISGSPATWTLEGGKLPRGLEFIDWLGTGIIYGSPEETGTFNITIKATNEINSDTKQFSLTVGTTTPVIPAIASKANPLKAWMQSGTLYLSGLTAGKAWSIYTAKGTLLHSGTASSAEMNVKLNMASGVYFVKTSGQTLKIMNR